MDGTTAQDVLVDGGVRDIVGEIILGILAPVPLTLSNLSNPNRPGILTL
jgi:hypothetical protein